MIKVEEGVVMSSVLGLCPEVWERVQQICLSVMLMNYYSVCLLVISIHTVETRGNNEGICQKYIV